jgi:aryl carrier-like protein
LPDPGSPAEILGQHVLVARMPASAATTSETTPRRIESVSVGPRAATPASAETARRLREALPDDRRRFAVEYVAEQVAAVLRVARPETLDPRQPLMDLGLDSLMAVELRSRLALGLGLGRGLPATLIFEHPSIEAIAELLVRQVTEGGAEPAEPPTESVPPTPRGTSESAARIAELSESEVEALLLKKLETL